MEPNKYYNDCIRKELARRCETNPRYSLRAFAKALNLDAPALSRILAGVKVPSIKVTDKILKVIDLSVEQRTLFIKSVIEAQRERSHQKLNPMFRAIETEAEGLRKSIDQEVFKSIADWYHFAILELTFIPGFKMDSKWIAGQLGISALEAKLATKRLIDLGLLIKRNGKILKAFGSTTTADKSVTTAAHRRRQRQILEKAIYSLENDPIDKRDTSALCMAIDPKKIPEAKQRIQKFKNELCDFLESGDRKRVYELSISLFPTQKENP